EGGWVAGLADGKWRQLGPTGTVLGEYEMKVGSGVEKRWYDDGPLYSERTFESGLLNGKLALYDHDGSIAVSAKYLFGKLDGNHVVGSKANLRIEEEFKNGVHRNARQIWQF